MKEFRNQPDLNLAVDEWTKKPKAEKSWTNFKIFFSKEIKKNNTRGGTFKQMGLANAVMQQRLETSNENQQILTANSIEQNNAIESQNNTIVSLLTRIDKMEASTAGTPTPAPEQANAATTTDSNAKMMEMMMKMMGKMTTGGSKGETPKGDTKGVSRRNDKNGKRSHRRYGDENDNYCWTCGFDIGHTSSTCQYIVNTANHKKEATASNTMGGSQRNMHLRTTGA
jgi:hypothetical protein